MDTKFSTAIHILIMISESETVLTSKQIAGSVGTNASYIRKILGLLKQNDLIESHQGMRGFTLIPSPDELTLLEIYQAVNETRNISLFDIHQNANDACVVGRYINPVLKDLFSGLESSFSLTLSQYTLADCIKAIREKLEQEKTDQED